MHSSIANNSRASSGVWPQSDNTPAREEGQTPLLQTTPCATQKKVKNKRESFLKIRCTDAEKKTIKKKAKEAGYNVSDFMRFLVFDKSHRFPKATKVIVSDPCLIRSINAIGINVNQIAKDVNRALLFGMYVDWDKIYSVLISILYDLNIIAEGGSNAR
ncbi:MAG: plasmid mobilization relaxosome protein MobC [Verrucomicrobiaceae bacterium]|nr:plasmid mobilization relaxosome protein MobC [Verrucomicrobiaceae bacterium]